LAVQSARLSTGIGKPLVLLNEYLICIDLGQGVIGAAALGEAGLIA
jgi:hypothetical protein